MASASSRIPSVVDLTNLPDPTQIPTQRSRAGTSQNRPSFPLNREVIDVDALPDRPSQPLLNDPGSPELIITGSRPAPPRLGDRQPVEPQYMYRPNNGPNAHGRRGSILNRAHSQEALRRLSVIHDFQRGYRREIGEPMRQNGDLDIAEMGRYLEQVHPRRYLPAVEAIAHVFARPDMDYQRPGFELFAMDDEPAAPPPPRPTYSAPKPPPEGFTRSPTETDVIICPNCEMELTVGDKNQVSVYVVKACGHVYCGECAKNRFVTNRRKNLITKSKPFKQCVVDTCKSKVANQKSMIPIYL
ncbi:MAG: hypothetical protein M1824_001017 [Vezdaea acicularis]|nr:MAG: hypothetical protein M1824_001017 [Vezdaea acicularis]